jgi:hypothetical protein
MYRHLHVIEAHETDNPFDMLFILDFTRVDAYVESETEDGPGGRLRRLL